MNWPGGNPKSGRRDESAEVGKFEQGGGLGRRAGPVAEELRGQPEE